MTKTNQGPAPEILTAALHFLNGIVIDLFRRTTVAKEERPDYVGQVRVVDDPEDAEQIFKDYTGFQKNFALVAAIGASRFNLNGEKWSEFRARTQPYYSKAGKGSNRSDISEIYRKEISKIDPDDTATIEKAFASAALKVFFNAFDIKPDVAPFLELFARLRNVAAILQHRSWSGDAGAVLSKEEIFHYTTEIVQEFWTVCCESGEVAELVYTLSSPQSQDDLGAAVTDMMTNMFAGIETTTATLCWTVDCLGKNIDAQKRIYDEITGDTQSLKYAQAFLHETMRCFPPIPFVMRESTQDTMLGQSKVEAGEQIMVSVIGIHRDSDAWDNPNEFFSARDVFLGSSTPPTAFRPFLSGPRVCGGRRLAEMEIVEAIRLFLTEFEVENPVTATQFNYALALRPVTSPELVLRRR